MADDLPAVNLSSTHLYVGDWLGCWPTEILFNSDDFRENAGGDFGAN
jgi:hypothetical protein